MSLKEICDNIDKCHSVTELKVKSDQIRDERRRLQRIIGYIDQYDQCAVNTVVFDIAKLMCGVSELGDKETAEGLDIHNRVYTQYNVLLRMHIYAHIKSYYCIDDKAHIETHFENLELHEKFEQLQQQQEADAVKHREKIDKLEKSIDTRDSEIIMLNESNDDYAALREKCNQRDAIISSLKEENKMLTKCQQNLLAQCNDMCDKLSDITTDYKDYPEPTGIHYITYSLMRMKDNMQQAIDANVIITATK